MNHADRAAHIADKLVKEALWDGARATWLGDEIEPDASGTGGTLTYRALGGDLYGGTAGIGLFLARYAAASGDAPAAETARAALAHATVWAERTRPGGALMSGTAGIATAALDAAHLLGDDGLARHAARLTRATVHRIPAAADLVGGRAGTLLALTHLARRLPDAEDRARAARAADATATSLHTQARPGPLTGICWPSDLGGAPLCGLAHGAAGIALALLEHDPAGPRALHTAAEAATFERAWFSPEHGTWADLRDLATTGPTWPEHWCHGALGVGVARLRLYDLTGRPVYAAEAGAAVDSAARRLNDAAEHPAPVDMSTCHGLAGAAELLLDAARVLRQPALRALAAETLTTAAGHVTGDEWPCGIPGGGENPSLFTGLAGIGTALLRVHDPALPSTVAAYAGATMQARLVVQLTCPPQTPPEALREQVETVSAAVPGARVERVSPRGRALLRLPAGADVTTALDALNRTGGVAYAELDVTDTAQD
ncbi:lanthionine synthetase LanC family protein [Sinosporangium siamense]|uniref:Fervidolysin-like N-terminal prodomain domain-containing protein n=1 Tax=Sinosporangium siamense TaxID=1367973 RepID=A0A919RM66_9ACTN|nr:lanthionine synthetase LanC family protein [Sinosporangium siamense]GII96128.1 hypothetical protein Ssi02_63590 [Sinosporangium siamense]